MSSVHYSFTWYEGGCKKYFGQGKLRKVFLPPSDLNTRLNVHVSENGIIRRVENGNDICQKI